LANEDVSPQKKNRGETSFLSYQNERQHQRRNAPRLRWQRETAQSMGFDQ
jgi:hypothetical protein